MNVLEFHELAKLFIPIEGDEFEHLVEDIREHGIRDPITLHEGQVLDGCNRYRALVEIAKTGEVLGPGWGHRANSALDAEDLVPPHVWFTRYNAAFEGDPLKWVISKNLMRRHLDESQRSMVAADIGKLSHGGARGKCSIEPLSAAQRARLLSIARISVRRADQVKEHGAPELADAVRRRKVAVSTAEVLTQLPQDEQAEIVAKGEREILAKAKEINAEIRSRRRQEVRQMHEELSRNSAPLPQDRKYPVIYADPATEFKSGFGNRSIENHYPTESIDFWCTLPVGDLALDHCLLFCWTTVPQLAETIAKLLPAWGFEYKSCLCWDKTSPDHPREAGTGYWVRNQHELLLVATRGSPSLPEPADVPVSMYRERKGEHSAKPDYYRDMIEAMTPGLSRIELFARSPRPGWERWGNQAGVPASAETPDDSEAA
ncbi:MT-A70 family methyltransferase [Bradyrhizobium sp. PMVTL-01]|uniref:MT-A70 family methyltransferase n=1 Tax=Bradyrhizobium sp. PMVTL-01 TaxID=3434999 RepID=UPI003F71008B